VFKKGAGHFYSGIFPRAFPSDNFPKLRLGLLQWGPSTEAKTNLESCRLGNCTFWKFPLGKIFLGSCRFGKFLWESSNHHKKAFENTALN